MIQAAAFSLPGCRELLCSCGASLASLYQASSVLTVLVLRPAAGSSSIVGGATGASPFLRMAGLPPAAGEVGSRFLALCDESTDLS